MSLSQRRKGATGERELFKLLSDELGFVVQRTLDQTRTGGADCIEVPGFAVEVKRQERLSRPAWWRQAVRQGNKLGAEPIVFYRRSREPWRSLVRTVDGGYDDFAFEKAVMHIREKLARLHGIYPKGAA